RERAGSRGAGAPSRPLRGQALVRAVHDRGSLPRNARGRRLMAAPLLEVSELSVRFDTDDGPVHAVDGVSFVLGPGDVLGIVGESGWGKTAACLSLARLLPENAAVTGRVVLDGVDLLSLAPRRLRQVRGRELAYVFQEPMTSLNP